MTTTRPPSADDSPIATFSNCHAGIVGQLQALDALPAVLDAARQARRIAEDTRRFFREVVLSHHADEERALFPAVLASAAAGDERDQVRALVERLTAEHRGVEAAFARLEPALADIAKGRDAALDAAAVAALVDRYRAHAQFEEAAILPLSQAILGRNANHLAALGLSLHARHLDTQALAGGGFHV